MKSWNSKNNLDCFGNGNPTNLDHIWPLSKGGANNIINKQKISVISNEQKADKTKGKIDNIRFSVVRATDSLGNVYGKMQIKNSNDEWEWVEPVR